MTITHAKYLISNADVQKCPMPDRPEYAFIGRSNVGKSSLINMLTGRNALAKVSGNPGKTTLINHFLINADAQQDVKGWYLVDLPGYGFAKRSKNQRLTWQKMIANYLQTRQNLQTVFVLIDSRLAPQKIDLDFINQLGEWQIPFNIVFTKTDKNNQSSTAKNVHAFIAAMSADWAEIPQYFLTSAVKKSGRNRLLDYISSLNILFIKP